MADELKIKVRNYREATDEDYVVHSWLKCQRGKPDNAWLDDEKAYWTNYSKYIKRLLEKNHCLVACDPDNESQLFGYLYVEEEGGRFMNERLHVKALFAPAGVGQLLTKRAQQLYHIYDTKGNGYGKVQDNRAT
jgi:hypothetical protein